MSIGDAVAMTLSFVNAWSGIYLDWHKHHCSWQSSRNTRMTHDANDIMSPDRESQMYSHYVMLCEHLWWYLSLGSSSQLH